MTTGGNSVMVWDVRSAKLLEHIPDPGYYRPAVQAPDGRVISLVGGSLLQAAAVSPDGRTLACGIRDWNNPGNHEIELRDVTTGRLLKTLPHSGLDNIIRSLSFSPDGHILAVGGGSSPVSSGGSGGYVKLCAVSSGVLLRTLAADDVVESLAFSSDGKLLATGSYKIVRLWDVQTGLQTQVVKGQPDLKSPRGIVSPSTEVNSQAMTFLPGRSSRGYTLLTGGAHGISFWNTSTGMPLPSSIGTRADISKIAVSADGILLAIGTHQNTIELWNLQSPKLLRTITGHIDPLNSLSFSPDANVLAAGTQHSAKLWRIK